MTAVGDELRALAQERDLATRRNLLVSLADAVDGGKNADEWATIDLHSALGAPVIATTEPEKRQLTVLEIIRVVLIFLPIMSTWFGLDRATRAYSNLTEAQRANGPSFFQQWLTGFGGRLTFSFTTMTWVTLALVLLVIVVSVAIEVLQNQATLPSEEKHLQLTERLAAALAEASLLLAKRRLSTPARFREEMTKAAAEMNQALVVIRDVSSKAAKLVLDLGAAETSSQDAMRSLTAASDSFGTSSGALAAAVSRLADDHTDRLDTLTLAVEAAARSVELNLSDREAQLDRLLAESRDRDRQLIVEALESFRASVTEIARQFGSLDRGTAAAIADARRTMPEVVRPVEASLDRLERLASDLVTAVAGNSDRRSDGRSWNGQVFDPAERAIDLRKQSPNGTGTP